MTAADTPRTDERATLTEAEEQAWEELWETDAARCCSCPSCNFYAPDYEQHGGEPCILRTLIERIVTDRLAAAVARAEAAEAKLAAVEALVADPFDEDGYCRWCDNGRWKAGHAWECAWADATDEALKRAHNHPPHEPPCNERQVGGHLRGACLNDDGSDR